MFTQRWNNSGRSYTDVLRDRRRILVSPPKSSGGIFSGGIFFGGSPGANLSFGTAGGILGSVAPKLEECETRYLSFSRILGTIKGGKSPC